MKELDDISYLKMLVFSQCRNILAYNEGLEVFVQDEPDVDYYVVTVFKHTKVNGVTAPDTRERLGAYNQNKAELKRRHALSMIT